MKQIPEKKLLELVKAELAWTDEAIDKFSANESLPEPLDCKPGCHYCCFNLPMVTPLETLLIGYHLDQTFTDAQKHALNENIRKIQKKTDGKPFEDVLMMRHELPCIFLKESRCIVYGVRPAVCRTCSSTSAAHCKMIFETRNHRARLRCYPQIREIFHIVHSRFIDRCREMGCQSDALHIHGATADYFRHPKPIEAWLSGESVFQVKV